MENDDHIPENLRRAGKEHPFRVPDNYFESFAGRLQERIYKEKPVPASGRLIRFLKPALSMAAIITGALLITWFGYRQVTLNDQNGTLDNFELSDIVDYYLPDYDEDLLMSTIIETGDEAGLKPLESYSDDIYDYLNVDGIDYSLLINDK